MITLAMIELIKMRSPGANMVAIRADDFLRRANGRGLAAGDQASSRTYPDEAERQTDIYGSEGRADKPQASA